MRDAESRFWAKVERTPTCWLWRGYLVEFGYGGTYWKGRAVAAHRVAWELANGPIPNGLWVLHHCDIPACVRPDHLFLGTTSDNMRDMVAKGRHALQVHPELRPVGSRAPWAKLDEAKVVAIRKAHAEGESKSGLARKYGVSRRAAQLLLSGKTWRHVPDEPTDAP